jgi:hypothetical protein
VRSSSGGLLFSDDCNHDVDGLYAKSFEDEMRRAFPGTARSRRFPNSHPLYRRSSLPTARRRPSHELNGWGDDMVHDYLRGVEQRGRSACSIRTRTTAASGTTTGATSVFRATDNTRFAVNLVVYAMT